MENLILFINSFLSYLLVFAVAIVVIIVAVIIGIKLRKNKDNKLGSESTSETEDIATE